MAQFRYVYCKIWSDIKVIEDFTPEDKLFWLYLLTNERTNQLGVYTFVKKIVAFEIGYSEEAIISLIKRFEEHHKLIHFDKDTNEIVILKWGKYNLKKGGTPILSCVNSDLKKIKNKKLLKKIIKHSEGNINKDVFKILLKASKSTNNDSLNGTTNRGSNHDTNRYTNGGENKKEKENKKKDGVENSENVKKSKENEVEDNEKKITPQIDFESIREAFNSICINLPDIKFLTNSRKLLIKNFFKEYPDINILDFFKKVNDSAFLNGSNNRKWYATFNWIMQSDKIANILEDNYLKGQSNKTPKIRDKLKNLYDKYSAKEEKEENNIFKGVGLLE